jgi:tetratricopeptide (TPR) repeat protein
VITRARYNRPFRCYRGSKISREEIEQWYSEKLVATNTFWSTSLDKNVAQPFADVSSTAATFVNRNRENKIQHVLFEIDIDFTHSPNLIIADVSHLSAFEDEHEILFDLGTPLYIVDKIYDEENRVWCIRMSSSSEVDILDNDYNLYVHQRLAHTNAAMLYGNLLVGALGDYKEAVVYFQRLLRVLPKNDENRPNIYYELGRVYSFMGKHEQSIEYFRAAQLFQKRNLPQSKFDYALTLAGLADVYSEMGNLELSIRFNERALAIYETRYPKDLLEINKIVNALAYDLYKDGQYERAFNLLSDVDTSSNKKLFLTNPQTQLYYTLGFVHRARGNRVEAVKYLKQALELREKWSHKYHPYTARICYELSLLYEEDNDHLVALEHAQRALYIRQARGSSNKIELKQSIELVERLLQSNAREK